MAAGSLVSAPRRAPARAGTAARAVLAFGLVAGALTSAAGTAIPARAAASEIVVWDKGLGPGWQDYGWAPRTLKNGAPARLDFANYGGWIIAKPDLQGTFASLTVRYRAPEAAAGKVSVRLAAPNDEGLPEIPVGRTTVVKGWRTVTLPVARLDPDGRPFDRIVIRAVRQFGQGTFFEFDRIALRSLGDPGAKGSAAPSSGVGARAGAKASSAPQPRTISVNCAEKVHPISPLIYGINLAAFKEAATRSQYSVGATSRRWGGNSTTRYNWKLGNAWSTAYDYYWRNVDVLDGSKSAWRDFMDRNKQNAMTSALTVPMIGWVAKDSTSYAFPVTEYGAQQQTDPYKPDAGNGVSKSGKPLDPPEPERTSVVSTPESIGEWVSTIKAEGRSVSLYYLDNEPDLWHETHRDVHPRPTTYDEVLARGIDYASAIRKADPDAVIAGPASWGWPGFEYSAADAKAGFAAKPDRRAHDDTPFIPWYLQQMNAYEKRTGTRLLDVLDVHWYPQGAGVHKYEGGNTDPKTAALRIRSTRQLWDTGYADESWIDAKVALLPRLQKWVDENYPGVGISIGEWAYGAETHMSGGLATAEALGRFGQAGIQAAYYWTYPPEGSPAYWAFRAYRNYDGKGARFGDTSVATTVDNDVSVFGSLDSDGNVVAVILNLSSERTIDANLSLANCGGVANVQEWSYDGGADGFRGGAPTLADGTSAKVSMQPWSVHVMKFTTTTRKR